MEKNIKEKTGLLCDCENCQVSSYHSYRRHFFLRWFLGLLILGIVFCMGVKIGEFKEYFSSMSGGDWGPHHNVMFERRVTPLMMDQAPTSTTTKSTTTTTK